MALRRSGKKKQCTLRKERRIGGKARRSSASSFVMSPQPDDLHNPAVFENLIHQTVLNVYSARIGSNQITNEFLVPGRTLKGVLFENLKQFFGFRLKAGSGELFRILLGLFGVNKRPFSPTKLRRGLLDWSLQTTNDRFAHLGNRE